MKTITKIVVLAALCLIFGNSHAQDSIQKQTNQIRIERLEQLKVSIPEEEKALLKSEVERIMERHENKEINDAEAETLKKEVAKKRALNIENRLAIVEHQIAILERNLDDHDRYDGPRKTGISVGGMTLVNENPTKSAPKYDLRTSSQMLFAMGFNNTIIEGQSLEDSPYKIGGSGFVELGWLWQTRLFKNTNFVRVNYGLSFQWNKLSIKNNQYFVTDGEETKLETFPLELKKSKFRTTSLVVPVHFEFGPSKLKDYGNRIRYFTDNQFKIGLGGFAGVNVSTMQKLKYKEEGKLQKQKHKEDFNTTNFVYGISGYIGVGDFSIYAKYNLNELFKNQNIEQHNISLGVRWALD